MRLNRLLVYINVLIGVALLVLLAVTYWFAYRVLPKTSGQIEAPVSGDASIVRDKNGVPHIRAASVEDALFLQGYVTAQDRLWQLDALRRFAGGELSEVIGSATLEADRESRRLRTRRLADAYERTVPAADRAYMAAYARGINYFIDTHRSSFPLEFTILAYEPRHWSIADSILVGLHMARDLTTSWKGEIAKATMLARGDKSMVAELFPPRTGREISPGSNAWAVSGKWTASGKPILANDTHLEYSIPSPWYMVHLQAPSLNVSGESLPGVPGVIIGHNDRIAWGVTNLEYDVQDLYIEQINLGNGQYVANGATAQARPEREYIRVKDSKPVEFVNWVTRHGPLITNQSGHQLSLRWAAADFGTFDFPFVQLAQARNWGEFRAAVARFPGPGQNFVYADVDGNIGYQVTGRNPIRKAHAGDVPVAGASGEFEWFGFIPFDELPNAFNPPGGVIVTANQNPFPDQYVYPVHGQFASTYRVEQIKARLASRKGWKPAEMLDVQKDVYSGLLHFVAMEAARAYERHGTKDEQAGAAVDLLKRWNGQMEKGSAAPLIASLTYRQLQRKVAERAAPGSADLYAGSSAGHVIEKLLRERPKRWFQNYDEMLLRCLLDALEEGMRRQGRNIAKWDYGVSIELHVRQPVGNQIPIIGPYFNIGPVPMSGSSSTVKQTTARIGPSMRFIADLSNWDNSLNNITIGQSGQFLSSHYKDQWDEYYVGKSLPMVWSKIEGDTLRVTPLR